MIIKYLGAGGFFTTDSFHTNIVIEHKGKRLLLDAGSDLKWSSKHAGLKPGDFDGVYISHCHGDHVQGLEWLGFGNYFMNNKKRIPVFGAHNVLDLAWNGGLRASMQSVHGDVMEFNDYFNVINMRPNESRTFAGLDITAVQAVHVMNGFEFAPCYGLMIVDPKTKERIFYTADTQFAPGQLIESCRMADIVLHDCETSKFKSIVHANYEDLRTYPDDIKSKIILHHVGDEVIHAGGEKIEIAFAERVINDGFLDVASVGSTYDTSKILAMRDNALEVIR